MSDPFYSAYATSEESAQAAEQIIAAFGDFEPQAVVCFHSPEHDGTNVSSRLQRQWPSSHVVACSSCGQFTDRGHGKQGVAALGIGPEAAPRAASALARFDGGVHESIRRATAELSSQIGQDLRELDPNHWVGLVLIEGTRMHEEEVNEALGNAAPLLSFVGGSAGDHVRFEQSWVHHGGETTEDGAALLLMRVSGPFDVVKMCNYAPTEHELLITKADPSQRLVMELDGRPAAEVYGGLVGVAPDALDISTFLFNPVGLTIEGQPWLRSPFARTENGLMFACEVLEGMRVSLMQSKDIVADTKAGLQQLDKNLGRSPRAALFFNCAYRMLEVEALGVEDEYYGLLSRYPVAGLNTHGESWLGHINQTMTGLAFG